MSLLGGKAASKAKGTSQQPRMLLGYQVQSSCQGTAIALVYGQQRIPGNLIWAAGFRGVPQYTTTSTGGGGGGGKGAPHSQTTTQLSSYQYYMDVIFGVCIGPITGVATVYDGSTPYPPASWFDLISPGGRPAAVWGYLAASYPAQALPYSGIAAACKAQLYLGESAQLPSFNFEVQGLKQFAPAAGFLDANPADILYDFLTNKNYGCGWDPSLIGDLTQYSNYCIANNIFLSPQLTSQEAGSAFIYYLMQLSNSEVVWSGGQLKGVPYGDTPATGPPSVQVTPYYYIPGSAPYTIAAPNWLADSGVMVMQMGPGGLWQNYEALTPGDPANLNYYSAVAGTYTFNAGNAGEYVAITYWATPQGVAPVTYTPQLAPQYSFGPDDFIAPPSKGKSAAAPVTASRTAISDAYNWFQLEFYDRSNDYNPALADCKDQNAVDLYGPRIQTNVEAHAITNCALAQFIGQTLLQRSLYIRNTYKFKVDGRYFLLDPMDWVSLTAPKLGLNGVMCRIVSIQENDDGSLDFEAEEWPEAAGTPALHAMQSGTGLQQNLNAAPGNINPPIIFEAPALLTQAGYEVWVGACGLGPAWGGAEVWVSLDNLTYRRLGLVLNPCRMGVLAAQLAAGSDPDTTDSCQVDLTESQGVLLSGTQQDADLLATACYVDGEVISYETATLTAAYKYTLGTYLRRGACLTAITAHAQNSPFLRLDQAVFKIPVDASHLGQTLYIKFLSFNLWRGATQQLSDVEPYTHYLSGAPMIAGLPPITNLGTFYQSSQMSLAWDKAADPLAAYRLMDYEVRKGTAWATAEIVARTAIPACPCFGNGTYWVAAHYNGYYGPASSLAVTNASIITTILASYDDYANGWPGTMSGGVFKDGGGDLEISGGGPGYYTIAAAQLVNLGSAQLVTVAANYLFESVLPGSDVDSWSDWDSIPDVDGLAAGMADVKVQLQVSTDGSAWGAWQDLRPGQYYAWKINLRLGFTVYQLGVTPVVSEFNWQVGH